MSIYAVYRTAIWLPIAVPVALIAVVNAFDLRHTVGGVGQIVAFSLVYGGIPYAALAAWATWWVGGRPEPEIRRLMFLAPLVMAAVFDPLALVLGLVTGDMQAFIALAILGTAVIIPLGYLYVGLAVLLRLGLGPRVA
jgi:hypothetical protein